VGWIKRRFLRRKWRQRIGPFIGSRRGREKKSDLDRTSLRTKGGGKVGELALNSKKGGVYQKRKKKAKNNFRPLD